MQTTQRAIVLCCALAWNGCQVQGLSLPSDGGIGGRMQSGGGGTPGTGGASGGAGAPGAGGATGTGGAMPTTGGAPGNDGGIGLGGAVGTGGTPDSGSGGAGAAGGRVGAGGTPATGGVRATGGIVAAGGRLGAGGAAATGGISGAGATRATGGTPGTGGLSTGGTPATGGASGSGGGTGQMCGGLAGLHCGTGQFCDYATGDCGKVPDGAGVCAATGGFACPAIYAPVCGCDGKTYPSDCDRRSAGVSKMSDGECASAACPPDLSQISNWPCTEGLTCEYGTDPRPSCRDSAVCAQGTWAIADRELCVPLPEVNCPETREAAAGQSCPTQDAYCVYQGLACQCTNCTSGPVEQCAGDPTWHCAAPNPDAACPAAMPLLGTACTTENQSCRYSCGSGGARLCKQGAWYAADGGPCPVSTRRAKKDIVYLDRAARARIANDLAHFKLATYLYRDPALAGRRHLGFIIEDVPASPAVDRDGNMVDLYGYASMLVAAVQTQGEELRKLRAEVARLKRRARIK